MKKNVLLLCFVLICAPVFAQNVMRTIPRVIFVGDPAVLIFSLPPSQHDAGDIILFPLSPDFPSDENIDFHRITLERRSGPGRLLIEFTAFVPGLLEFPVINIGGESFYGLTVNISSVIDLTRQGNSALELSQPASFLLMPGTALMLYGIITGLLLLFILTIWFLLKGRKLLRKWIEKVRRWLLIVSIKNTEKKLYRALMKGKNKRGILDSLSCELRIFLSSFTGKNCRAMTANEFKTQPDIVFASLGDFFRRCDEIRFSGIEAKTEDISSLLAEMRNFIKEITV